MQASLMGGALWHYSIELYCFTIMKSSTFNFWFYLSYSTTKFNLFDVQKKKKNLFTTWCIDWSRDEQLTQSYLNIISSVPRIIITDRTRSWHMGSSYLTGIHIFYRAWPTYKLQKPDMYVYIYTVNTYRITDKLTTTILYVYY